MKYSQKDIVWVRFPFTDGSSAKRRPALVISNEMVNRTGDYLLVQITSKEIGDELSFRLTENFYEENPLRILSFIRVHKIFI